MDPYVVLLKTLFRSFAALKGSFHLYIISRLTALTQPLGPLCQPLFSALRGHAGAHVAAGGLEPPT